MAMHCQSAFNDARISVDLNLHSCACFLLARPAFDLGQSSQLDASILNASVVMLAHRYSGPVAYDAAYDVTKAALSDAFFGPAQTGVYSPSVQYTLFQMAKEALKRWASGFQMLRCPVWCKVEVQLKFI